MVRSRRGSHSGPSSSSSLSSESFEPLLQKLLLDPEHFSPDELRQALDHLFSPDAASEFQIGAFLALLRVSGLEGRPEMMSMAAQTMRERAVRVDLSSCSASTSQQTPSLLSPEDTSTNVEEIRGGWADLVGTGGDGKDTFNVSTTAALVAAGAGVRVCKHGARASSSASGSADVLLALGIPIPSLPLSRIPTIASSLAYPFLFLFAPLCHPAMALVAPIRRQLGHPTIFNVLGPLLNPARPEYMVVGVHSKYLGRPFAESLRNLGVRRAWVVNGDEGLDEISPTGHTHVWALSSGQITEKRIHPSMFGLKCHELAVVAGGKPHENANLILRLLRAELDEDNPVENFVVMNAAALLVVSGRAVDEKDGVAKARLAIREGKALKAFEDYRDAAQRAVKQEQDDDDSR